MAVVCGYMHIVEVWVLRIRLLLPGVFADWFLRKSHINPWFLLGRYEDGIVEKSIVEDGMNGFSAHLSVA